ncbi:MAG: hypothetical protein J6Y55_10045 [Bacteroidales bacterium]|nr:hypothetical protein [Bacteroidales bacterium]
MKHLQFFATLLIAGTVFTACGNDDDKKDEPKPETEVVTNGTFVGTMVVNLTDGTTFPQEEVSVDYNLTDTAGYVLTFYQVSFSPKMPVKLDLIIPNVENKTEDGKAILSGNEIIPLAMNKEFPQYTITNLSGTINDGTLSVSYVCGQSPITFTGSKK